MHWTVYLSGEIHTDWRLQIEKGAEKAGLPVDFVSPVTDHAASDAAGDVLGREDDSFWRDHKSSKVNSIRTRTMIERYDVAVVRFGDKYKQWNAAFDAGYCAALGKPYITLHDESIVHALNPHYSRTHGCGRGSARICGVALGKGARRTYRYASAHFRHAPCSYGHLHALASRARE